MSTNNFAFPKIPIVIKKKSSFKINQHIFRDTIIYDSKGMNYFKDKYEIVTLVNRQNIITNSCRLLAKIKTINGQILELCSDQIVSLIGQEQFEVLFMALCSIINQELRIRGLISILSMIKIEKTSSKLKTEDRWSQTDETRLEKVTVSRKRRIRRHLAPYVVQDFQAPEKIKKVVVDVSKYTQSTSNSSEKEKEIPDLGYLQDDLSNHSVISDFSASIPELLTNPSNILKNIDNYTNKHEIPTENVLRKNQNETHEMIVDNELLKSGMKQENFFNLILPDNSFITLPEKPEDHFHIATEDNLNFVDGINRRKLIDIQRIIDMKFCLTPVDDEGNLPIHMAVMNEDLHLLKRQCFMLNLKGSSVDIEANGLTPLKLSLFNESVSATVLLLSFGADPLSLDDTHSTYFHTAAELKTEHLSVLLQHCKNNARTIVSENEDLQSPGWEEKSDDELSSRIMDHFLAICDHQGYTPLMRATNLGVYHNVGLLLSHSPPTINAASPTSGNTALYLACYAACNAAAERGNKSKLVDHFRQTIEILLNHGADPTIDNFSGSNISVLLIDFQCPELSMLIANRGPASKFKNSTEINDSLMFIKDGHEMKKIKEKDSKERSELSFYRKPKKDKLILKTLLLSKSNSETERHGQKDFDKIKPNSNITKIVSNSIQTPENSNSNLSLNNSTKSPESSQSNKVNIVYNTKFKPSDKVPKLIQLKNTKTTLKPEEKPVKILKNVIVNKPDKMILKPDKLKVDNAIKQTDLSTANSSLIMESSLYINSKNCKLKVKNSQIEECRTIPNITFADYDPDIISSADYKRAQKKTSSSDIKFLYTPENPLKKQFNLIQYKNSVTDLINTKNMSLVTVKQNKPKTYVKKTICIKKMIKKKFDNDNNEVVVPPKTCKKSPSDSEQ